MTLIAIVDVYDRKHVVSKEDLENTVRHPRLVPLRFHTGRRYTDVPRNLRPKGGEMIHRENIARVMEL